jgi:ATP-dependent helicase/nuclease subunit B
MAVRLAHSGAMLGAGLRVWNTPDVLPWGAWIERELDAARARGESLRRRLSAPEEWLLWREAVQHACIDLDLLLPDALIEPVRRAIGRLDDYGLTLNRAATAEAAVLLQARAGFRRRCAELGAIGTTSWGDCAPHLQPSAQLLLAGFARLGPARRRWLEQHGARVAGDDDRTAITAAPVGAGDRPQVVGCDNPLLEAEAAAQWCAAQLERDAQARLLLVVPRLAQQRHIWQRALSHRLDFESLLGAGTSSGDAPFALEGGQPLSAYPLVATALQLIALAAGDMRFEQLSTVFRSAYLGALEHEPCLRIELWLREYNLGEVQPGLLDRLRASVGAELGEPAAAVLRRLHTALEAAGAPSSAGPAGWARAFASLLHHCGWPGTSPLGSDEQQVRMRFDELLGDFATLGAPVERLSGAQASQLLHDMAQRVAFEPASDDVPVTVTASLDDPIVHYDGIWVAGLTAGTWPPAPQPDPLLPPMWQRDAGLPEASPAGQLTLAQQRMRQWQRRAARCVWSWARSEAELPCDRSPLLDELPAALAARDGEPEARSSAFALEDWLVGQAPPLRAWWDASGPAWPRERPLRGGIRLLELQSLCPFRGFAELRLQARRLPQPEPGIDPRLRGQLLHRALELFWRTTGDSATLHQRSAEATRTLARQCVDSAIEQVVERQLGHFAPGLLRRERARTERLLGQLIEWELAREAFQTQGLESQQPCVIGGATLQLRLDRVDRLSDGRLVVIDYKSSAAQKFDPFADRPPQPQLPAYAMALGEQVGAVVAVHLGREGVKLRGLADRPERLRGIAAVPGGEPAWPPLLQRWREQLQRLVREFLGGYAGVQPQSGACEYCHLQMLCRVDAQVLAAAALAAAADTEAAQAARALERGTP